MSAEPLLAPYAGWLVKPEWAERVVSRAYDNLTAGQRRTIIEANPYSYVNVTRSSEDMIGDDDLSIYRLVASGADALTRLMDAAVFAPIGRAALHLYRLTHARGSQTGIICTASLDGFVDGRIRIHENVREDRTELLTEHLLGVGATSHPVALTVRAWADSEYAALLDEAAAAATPDLEFGSDLVQHQIWTVPEELNGRILAAIEGKHLYVADGHHRSAAAQRARLRQPANTLLARTLAAVFPHSQLHVEAYHRAVALQNHQNHEECLRSMKSQIGVRGGALERVRNAEDARPRHRGEVGVYGAGGWHRLTLPSADSTKGALGALDVDRLRRQVIDPVLGADELAATGSVDYVPDTAGLSELISCCDTSDRVGFVMYPLSVDELLTVADEAGRMPPKSSFFYPKPRAGAFLRVLGCGATSHLAADAS
ncbi:MAG: DUF1015 family protein [Acidimicrobiaceae bacterium]|nr:DUF1015 family protein [Acidimicrobiaceae bacterium]